MKKFSSIMKESSRQTSRKDAVRKVVIVSAIVLIAVTLFPRVAGSIASFVFSPIAYIETWLVESGSALPSYFTDRKGLMERNEELERQIANERGTNGTIARLQDENRALRALLGTAEDSRIAAGVIGRPTVTPYDVLVLDKGERDGVVQYAPVFIGSDQAIGYVAAVHSDTSVVTLVTTPDFESTVYIIGPNIYTTARGIGGGVLQVSVPQGIPLTIGDVVVVPTFNSGVYGTIDVVNSVPTEPEQRGYVTLDVPLQGIRFVTIGDTALTSIDFEDAVDAVATVKKDLTKVPVPSGVLVDVETATGTVSTASSTDEQE